MGGPLGRRCMRARDHPHRHGEAVDARSDDSQAARELPGHCAEDQDGAEPENRSIRQAPQVDLDSHQDEEEGDEEGRRRVEQFRERGPHPLSHGRQSDRVPAHEGGARRGLRMGVRAAYVPITSAASPNRTGPNLRCPSAAAAQATIPSIAGVGLRSQPAPSSLSQELFAQAVLAGARERPGVVGPIRHRRVVLPAGDAEEIELVWRTPSASGPDRGLTIRTYWLLQDEVAYELYFAVDSDHAEKYGPIFTGIAETFRLTRP